MDVKKSERLLSVVKAKRGSIEMRIAGPVMAARSLRGDDKPLKSVRNLELKRVEKTNKRYPGDVIISGGVADDKQYKGEWRKVSC